MADGGDGGGDIGGDVTGTEGFEDTSSEQGTYANSERGPYSQANINASPSQAMAGSVTSARESVIPSAKSMFVMGATVPGGADTVRQAYNHPYLQEKALEAETKAVQAFSGGGAGRTSAPPSRSGQAAGFQGAIDQVRSMGPLPSSHSSYGGFGSGSREPSDQMIPDVIKGSNMAPPQPPKPPQPPQAPKSPSGGGGSGMSAPIKTTVAPDTYYDRYKVQKNPYPFTPQVPVAGSGVKRSFFTAQEDLLKTMMPGWK